MLYLLLIITSAVLATYSTIRWRRLGFALTSPAGACLLLWSFIWLIHYLDIFEYYTVSDKAVLFSLLPVVSLFVGEEIGRRFRIRRRTRVLSTTKFVRLLSLDVAVAVFFSIVGLVSVWAIFGNPLDEGVGRIIKQARSEEGVAMLRGSTMFAIVQYFIISRAFLYVAFFSLIPLWLVDRRLASRIAFIVFAAAVIADMSWGSRTLILDALIFTVIWLAIAYPRSNVHFSFGNRFHIWLGLILVVSGLFIGAQRITESTRNASIVEVQGIEVPYSVEHLLKYYSATLVTFDQTLDSNDTRTFGLMSFGGALNILHFLRIYRNEDLFVYDIMYDWEVDNPNYSNGSYNRGNIYSWLRYFYSDFSVPGLIVLPALIGILSGISMKRVARLPNIDCFAYLSLSVCFYLVARSPILFSLRHDYIVLALALAIGIISVSSRKAVVR